jgi:hypothetical protein
MNIKIFGIAGLLIIVGTVGWLLQGTDSPATAEVSKETKNTPVETQSLTVATNVADFVSVRPTVAVLPEQILSNEERDGLIFMREEEKLARDVYSVLYDKWGLQIFSNIAQSEQTHTEAVRTILVKYNITDPVKDDSIGVFTNNAFEVLYKDLTAQGLTSLEDALIVGARIEDLDIADLQKQIALTNNDDITLVYENLMRASRNHLRAFVSQLTSRGGTYVPQYITQSEFDTIIASMQETGSEGGGRGWGKNR